MDVKLKEIMEMGNLDDGTDWEYSKNTEDRMITTQILLWLQYGIFCGASETHLVQML